MTFQFEMYAPFGKVRMNLEFGAWMLEFYLLNAYPRKTPVLCRKKEEKNHQWVHIFIIIHH